MKQITALTITFLLAATLSHGQQQAQLLSKAYKTKSSALLRQFFDNWAKETPPLSENEIEKLKDTVREAYKVYRAFYHPFNIGELGGSEWGNDIYSKVSWLVVQRDIWVGIV